MTTLSPLVDVSWLIAHRDDPALVILDASWHMPGSGRDGYAEFLAAHIPGSRFFDFDRVICDRQVPLPHMLPSPDAFTQDVRALGVNRDSIIVCYDTHGVFSAPRAWWMFRAMGHRHVAVLDGGLPAWRAAGWATVNAENSRSVAPGSFVARFHPNWVAGRDEVRRVLQDGDAVVVDARSEGRFLGREPEPRPGVRRGHMPGARNLPFSRLITEGRLLPPDRLRAHFDALAAGDRRLICTCGSGVTACVVALAAERAGRQDIAVYDGSWAEWGATPELPVVSEA